MAREELQANRLCRLLTFEGPSPEKVGKDKIHTLSNEAKRACLQHDTVTLRHRSEKAAELTERLQELSEPVSLMYSLQAAALSEAPFRPINPDRIEQEDGSYIALSYQWSHRGPGRKVVKENASSSQFLDLVRTDWAEVPSVRNALKLETPFRVGYGIDDDGDRVKCLSLTVTKCQTEHEGDKRKDSDDTLAQAHNSNSEVSSYEGV